MRIHFQFVVALLLPGSLCLSMGALDGQAPSSKGADRAAPVAATQAVPPAKPETQPPAQPRVSYRDGLLTIQAENATLGDILRAVQHATGATIDAPDYASERVYAHLGPGAPRDVLASLLNGSRYDYIMVGVPQRPNAVGRVMLTVRQNSPTQPSSTTVAASAAANNEDNDSPDDSPPDREPVPEPQPPPQNPAPAAGANPAQPTAPPPNPAQPGTAQPPNTQTPGQPQVKTPEQLLKELQQMRQQQQPAGSNSPSQ